VLVGGVLYKARDKLPDIVASIRSLKYKGVEMAFGSEVKAVAVVMQQVLPASEAVALESNNIEASIQQHVQQVAGFSPRGAILEAWLRIETAAVDIMVKMNLGAKMKYPSSLWLRNILLQEKILNKRQADAFESLRRLRNEVVHVADRQFTPEVVSDYLEAATSMALYLEKFLAEQ
ncbi:MAG TPA: hypothetical protein DCW29_13130, partial [Janthinobacterium sp.]|nr:hypothetical protein [Janthinobacterium sp.]